MTRFQIGKRLFRLLGPHVGVIRTSDFHEVEEVAVVRHASIPRGHFRRWSNWALDSRARSKITRAIRLRRPDVIHVHTEALVPAAIAARGASGIPVAVTLHGQNTDKAYTASPSQARRWKSSLGAADRVILVGEPLRPYATNLSGRDDLVVVPNGVTKPSAHASKPVLQGETVRFIAVCDLRTEKGLHVAVDALSELRRRGFTAWSYRVVGEGPARRELEQHIKRAGLVDQVSLVGLVPNHEVFDQLSEADVFLLPSYREAFGVAYLEAMAMGLLAVGVEGQGPSTFLQDGETGMLVPPRNWTALADRLVESVWKDQETWRAVALAGQSLALREFSWCKHAQKLESLFHDLDQVHLRTESSI